MAMNKPLWVICKVLVCGIIFICLSLHLERRRHVRVDVFYAGLQRKTKSILNMIGVVFFGLPLCWLILARGMWGKSSLINSPMLNFETSMSGFGMYVKYLMAAFLIVFALSMIFQFTAYLLNSMADIEEKITDDANNEEVNANGISFLAFLFILMMYASVQVFQSLSPCLDQL